MATQDPPEPDWIDAVFEVLREEVISIAADFGDRVKREIDQVAAAEGIRPPSAAALLASVAIETGNIAGSLFRRSETSTPPGEPPPADESPHNEEEES